MRRLSATKAIPGTPDRAYLSVWAGRKTLGSAGCKPFTGSR
jgi:hypothetical protein